MQTIKDYTLYIILALVIIIGSLSFMLVQSSNKNADLRAKVDLTVQTESSKVVDDKVKSAQTKIDTLGQEMSKPVSDEFWKEYTKDKK
jgi:preprotein translocase subunit SecF